MSLTDRAAALVTLSTPFGLAANDYFSVRCTLEIA